MNNPIPFPVFRPVSSKPLRYLPLPVVNPSESNRGNSPPSSQWHRSTTPLSLPTGDMRHTNQISS